MIALFLVLSVIVSTSLTIQPKQQEEISALPSFAFNTGLVLGRNFVAIQSGFSQPKGSIQQEDVNCLEQLSIQLQDELQGVGFRYESQLLAQISDRQFRQKICGVYENQKNAVGACIDETKQKNKPLYKSGILALLESICVNNKQALEKNSECLINLETTLHQNCVDACKRQAGIYTPSSGDSASTEVLDDKDNGLVCKIGACSVRCIAAQVQECETEEEINEENEEAKSELKAFYNELSGAQMLIGVESSFFYNYNQASSGSSSFAATYSLLKSGKFPHTCQEIIQNTVEIPKKEVEAKGKSASSSAKAHVVRAERVAALT